MPTLSTKGQIVIPADVRRRHGWKPGQRLDFIDTGDTVVVQPAEPEGIDYEAVRAALDRLGRGAYDGPPIPVEKLGMESISYEDMYPDGE